jgi:hypothetical protein
LTVAIFDEPLVLAIHNLFSTLKHHSFFALNQGEFLLSLFSSKRFLVIEDTYRRKSLWVYELDVGPFAKKCSSESIKHLTS